MTKKFMATVLAASIAMSAISAVPAMAKPSNGVRVLQGLAALYIISRVVKDNKTHRQPEATSRGRNRHTTQTPSRSRNHWDKPARPQRHSLNLPNRCLKTFYTRQGETRAYGAHCVNKQAPRLSLPQQCKRRISTDRGRRNVYGPNCLRQHGYHVARH